MSAKTKEPAKLDKRDQVLRDLEAIAKEAAPLRKRLELLIQKRNDLFVKGRSMNVPFTALGKAAGVRRETAHYATARASNGSSKTKES